MPTQSTTRRCYRPGEPCPVCAREKSCSIGEDGLIMCIGGKGPVPGWRFLGLAKRNPGFGLYRAADDLRELDYPEQAERTTARQERGGGRKGEGNPLPWLAMAKECHQQLLDTQDT